MIYPLWAIGGSVEREGRLPGTLSERTMAGEKLDWAPTHWGGVEHFRCFFFYFCLSRKSDPLKPGRLKYQSYNLLISLWALDGGERRGTKILNLYFVKTMPNWKRFALNICIASKFHSITHIEYLILEFLCCFFVLSMFFCIRTFTAKLVLKIGFYVQFVFRSPLFHSVYTGPLKNPLRVGI